MVLSAGMGAGHERVAAEVQRRLTERGIDSVVVDVLGFLPGRLGRIMAWTYRATARHLPWLYELVYRVWMAPVGSGRRGASILARAAERRLAPWLIESRPAAVVSTFHLASQVVGDLRQRGIVSMPAVSVVVDFAAHNLWLHPGIDVHQCFHERQAERLRAAGAATVVVAGPIVSPSFARRARETAARPRAAGRPPARPVVLIVGGSWGVGRLESTLRVVAESGRFRPVVVAGRHERLRRRLAAVPGATVLGWVDDMDRIMAGADAVVENAGGLTAMEAMSAGVPVVSFRPVAGHGRDNVAAMAAAGVSRFAQTPAELIDSLVELTAASPGRDRLTATAAGMFAADPLASITAVARPHPRRP